MVPILRQAWQIYRAHFRVICALVCIVWIPLELIISYMDYLVFDEEDLHSSWKLAVFFENFLGIIVSAGVTNAVALALSREKPAFGEALQSGLKNWPRMFWSRVLSGVLIALGTICLVIPGIYLVVRLCLVETVVVCEHESGTRAIARSWELTKDRFWPVFRVNAVLVLSFSLISFGIMLPLIFIPAIDHWILNAFLCLLCDFMAAFLVTCMVCLYARIQNENTPPPDPATGVLPA